MSASQSQKLVLATGASSGLGFESIKQLLEQSEQAYHFVLGVRSTEKVQAAYDDLKYDSKHTVTILHLDLLSLESVQLFTKQVFEKLGSFRIDILYLAAGVLDKAEGPGPHGSQWCAGYVVNHLAQHYLVHLLQSQLRSSKSRVVVVSSGAIRNVRDQDTSTLDVDLKANSGAGYSTVYSASKFTQLLAAHYWRRQLPECHIVAVSPGLIPSTGLATSLGLSMNMPDAKTVPEGAQNLLRAFTVQDFPADPQQIFLTSWGEWWSLDAIALSLDTDLQDKWCPGKEEIEKQARLSN
ncbi:hypothetical protein N7478_005773 [Penicillium angulare]|uniref:uncharacterized protein n=1 Tax=Penicillium angulare TaxID=116970 RepID=UPI0025411984|nr:uncharacterized protein N7478_005773 [Penicillium angulare]KAJ5280401.1 hypothetical protein N7478_005773 [Penicillium angulare]